MHFHKTYIQNTMVIMVLFLKILVSKSDNFLIPKKRYFTSAQQPMGFIVERKHKQTITTIVLPIFALGWLSMLAILIPLNSGEKIGFLG